MRKILVIFSGLVAALAVTVSLDRPLPDAELTLILPVPYNTLDPQRMSYSQDIRLAYGIYEQLVRWDNMSDEFDIVPALARQWDISDDGLVYTFQLDPDAKWSNGSPLIAEHIAYSWQRAMLPDTAADYSNLFFCIRGARDYFDWRSAQLEAYAERPRSERTLEAARALREASNQHYRETVGVEVVDDLTLRVTLERPTAYFLDLCAFAPFSPVYPPLLEDHLEIDAASGSIRQRYEWTKPPLIVTNGAYKVVSWKFKRAMRLERNPFYRAPEIIRSESINIRPITENNTSVLAFERGVADWHTDVRVEYIGDLLEAKREGRRDDVHALTTFGTYFWSFNCTPTLPDGRANPFHDARVRRAFTMSVDKTRIVESVIRGGEKVATTFIPPGSIPGFQEPEGLPLDIERARAEFADAGWRDRDGDGLAENEDGIPFPIVELLYSTNSYHEDVALAMGQMWEEALGVRVKLDGKETKVYKDELKKQNFMLARGGWFGDYGDPTTFHYLHRTGDGNNDRGYSDAYFDGLMDRADAEPDPDARMRILEEAERYTMEETLPLIPVFHYNWYYLFRPPTDADGNPNPGGLRNVSYHPRLVQYMHMLEVVDEDSTTSASAAP
jgi:oligopeptide transport system substrate-binding protein